MRGIFITGTDTGVGKTVITAGVLRHLRQQGVDAVPMKPVQTGAERFNGKLIAPDLHFHLKTASISPTDGELSSMAPYCYEPACSPHLAGRMEGNYPDIHHIVRCAEALAANHHCVLAEGAGGLMAPVNDQATMLDLIQALAIPVLLVARRGLGTINHSLLSIQALRAASIPLLGIVFNEAEDTEQDFIRQDNPSAVEAFGHCPVLGNVDYLGQIDPADETAWAHFEACMPKLQDLVERLR